MKEKLQPLRIFPGWAVNYNLFFEVDPSPDTTEWFYGSVMFSATNVRDGYEINMQFEPEGDPEGQYIIEFYKINKKIKRGIDKYQQIGKVEIKRRNEVVNLLEYFFENNELPQSIV